MSNAGAWFHRLSSSTLAQNGVGFFAGSVFIMIWIYIMQLQVGKSCITVHSTVSRPCEEMWEDRRKSYDAYIDLLSKKEVKRSKKFEEWDGRRAYDIYEPEWVCDNEKQVGPEDINIGDGPKFVCGPDSLRHDRDCLIYSIGGHYDFSFEEGVHKYAPNCEIHTFDGTMNLTKDALPPGLEEKRIHFHNWNMDTTSGISERGWMTKIISETMSELGHMGKTIHVFQIDCGGCEYGVMPQVIEMVKNGQISIDQIQIQMHGTDAAKIQKFFRIMRSAGYAIFHKESNDWGCNNGNSCVEYAFISMKLAKYMFWKNHCITRENTEMSNNSTVEQIQSLLCASCPFAMRRGMTDINVTEWSGYGRTGNALISIIKALNFAYTCKLTIQLPLHDIFQAFDIQPDHSNFDFRSRNGTIPRFCSNVTLPITRRAGFFWKFPESVGVNSSDYKKAQEEIPKFESKEPCLRKYLGICEPHYCVFPPKSAMTDQQNTIVGHVREGDVFPANFSEYKVHPGYGQPPLSYYLQAFAAYKTIVVVGQPGNMGPVRKMMQLLNKVNVMESRDVHLTNGSWKEDVRVLMCAQNIVISKSTLIGLFSLGFSSKMFTFRTCPKKEIIIDGKHIRHYYHIEIQNDYQPFTEWHNNAEGWVDMMLHGSEIPVPC